MSTNTTALIPVNRNAISLLTQRCYTLGEYVKQYILEHNCVSKYKQSLSIMAAQFERACGGPLPLSLLSSDLVNHWLILLERFGLSPDTVRSKRAMMKAVWQAAFDAGVIDTEPKRICKVRVPPRVPRAWSLENVAAILDAARQMPGRFNIGISKAAFYEAFVLTQFNTALRLCDMRLLKSSLRFGDGRIVVEQQKTDFPVKHCLWPVTLAAIRATYPPERELIFGDVSREAIMDGFGRMSKAVGLYGATKMLRRASATWVESELPGYAQRHLGHKTPGLAAKHYIDPLQLAMDKRESLSCPIPAIDRPSPAVSICREWAEMERLTPEIISAALSKLALQQIDLATGTGLCVKHINKLVLGRVRIMPTAEYRIRAFMGQMAAGEKPTPIPLREIPRQFGGSKIGGAA